MCKNIFLSYCMTLFIKMDRSGGSKRADTKGPLINAMKTDSASITPSDVYVLSTARLRV